MAGAKEPPYYHSHVNIARRRYATSALLYLLTLGCTFGVPTVNGYVVITVYINRVTGSLSDGQTRRNSTWLSGGGHPQQVQTPQTPQNLSSCT